MSDTANNTIQFELVSPERRLVSEPVNMAVVPGTEGQFGVLAGHSALVATLKTGVVELHVDGQDNRRIFIAGGFADVTPTQCTILAEEAINVADLDQDTLEQSAKDLNEDIGLAIEAVDKVRVQKRLDLVNAKLEAIAV